MRKNPKYVVANRRRKRRRVRRNQLTGARIMSDVVTPVVGGTAGFVGARLLSNGVAQVGALRDLLDKGAPAAEARNTKMVANGLGILATLGLATRVDIIKRNQGALITGMGLALTDRLLGMIGGDAGQYLSGMGEYVEQPLGEYVERPLGAYVESPGHGVGEYVGSPGGSSPYKSLGNIDYATAGMGQAPEYLYAAAGMGAGYAEGLDPSDQGGVDNSMDVMEAAAGAGAVEQAAAGMGETLYAAAGLGAGEEDQGLKEMYEKLQPPFTSIQTPTDTAKPVTRDFPYTRKVPSGLVTPEGRGYAGGLFARHLFGGMF